MIGCTGKLKTNILWQNQQEEENQEKSALVSEGRGKQEKTKDQKTNLSLNIEDKERFNETLKYGSC